MSIPFNDTSTLKGLVQFYEDEIGAENGDISGSTVALKKFAARSNLALDRYFSIAFPKSGTWKLDDSNHSSDFPEIKTNLIASQAAYIFTTDETGNLVLDIYRVYAKDPNGVYQLLNPVDPDSQSDMKSFYDGLGTTGTPTRYDKTANGIILDRIPSYNSTRGLKVSINREGSYFVYTDTTKKPGVCGLHHEYFFLYPAQEHARINGLKNYNQTKEKVDAMEIQIGEYYSLRTRDEKPRLSLRQESNK